MGEPSLSAVCKDSSQSTSKVLKSSCPLTSDSLLFGICYSGVFVFKMKIRGVGGFTPLDPEGSTSLVAPPTYTNHCGGRVWEGPWGWGAGAQHFRQHTHLRCGLHIYVYGVNYGISLSGGLCGVQ